MNPAGSIVGGLIGYALTVIALIPIYNTYLLVKIAGHHGALTILYFIPIVNIVIAIIVALGVGRAFGRGPVFSVFLLWLLAIIGYFILGYGNATYQGTRDTQRTAYQREFDGPPRRPERVRRGQGASRRRNGAATGTHEPPPAYPRATHRPERILPGRCPDAVRKPIDYRTRVRLR